MKAPKFVSNMLATFAEAELRAARREENWQLLMLGLMSRWNQHIAGCNACSEFNRLDHQPGAPPFCVQGQILWRQLAAECLADAEGGRL